MARGGQEEQTALGARRGAHSLLYRRARRPQLSGAAVRDLASKRPFVEDRSKWLEAEKTFIDTVTAELEAEARQFMRSNEGWREYLRAWAAFPQYAPGNARWARAQALAKGVEEEGLQLSPSAWAALGRRVKAEFLQPKARRDRQLGYDPQRSWDDRYAAEMSQPIAARYPALRQGLSQDELGLLRRLRRARLTSYGPQALSDAGQRRQLAREVAALSPAQLRRAGLDPAELRAMIDWRSGPVRGYKTFVVYHEAATEALDGSAAKPLPETPWQAATGSDEDAAQLLEDLERAAKWERFRVEERPFAPPVPGQLPETATIDYQSRTISVDANQPIAERATATLRAFCEIGDHRPPRDDDERKLRRAAAESAKFCIASLYGLEADSQSFPHLAEIVDREDAVGEMNRAVHARVKRILGYLDPKMRMKAEAEGLRLKQTSRAGRQA